MLGWQLSGHVAEDSTAELLTRHGRPLNAAEPVLSSETCPTKKGKGMSLKTAQAVLRLEVCRAVLRGLPCFIERSAVLY